MMNIACHRIQLLEVLVTYADFSVIIGSWGTFVRRRQSTAVPYSLHLRMRKQYDIAGAKEETEVHRKLLGLGKCMMPDS